MEISCAIPMEFTGSLTIVTTGDSQKPEQVGTIFKQGCS